MRCLNCGLVAKGCVMLNTFFEMLSESQIEEAVERKIDKLDALLLSGKIKQQDYDQEIHIVDKWSIQQFKALER